MRITNTMMTNRLLTSTNKNLTKLDNSYTQMSTGKKIQKASEDPIVASRALRFRTTVSDTGQYQENVKQATSWLEITESAFSNVNKILTSMQELCVYGSTDTLETSDREKIVTEYNDLLEQLEGELNVTYMGRYVFSGYKTGTAYITTDANGKNILNPDAQDTDGQYMEISIGSQNFMKINTLGKNVYSATDYNTLHGLDNYYDTLQNGGTVDDEELRNAISSMLGNLEEYTANVSKIHTDVGVKMERLNLIGDRLSEDKTNYTTLLANNEDVDYADATMNYNLANTAYQAALKVGMNITQISLVDYL